VRQRLVNVHHCLYGHVYFPVHSHGLKAIGHFLGARWTAPQASGLQSLVWRHQWEHTQEGTYRDLLVTYNLRCGKVILAFGPCANVRQANAATALAQQRVAAR
jgi:RNase_H superfamily